MRYPLYFKSQSPHAITFKKGRRFGGNKPIISITTIIFMAMSGCWDITNLPSSCNANIVQGKSLLVNVVRVTPLGGREYGIVYIETDHRIKLHSLCLVIC